MKKFILLILFVFLLTIFIVYTSQSGVYISGAHENNTYGVLRTSTSGFEGETACTVMNSMQALMLRNPSHRTLHLQNMHYFMITS